MRIAIRCCGAVIGLATLQVPAYSQQGLHPQVMTGARAISAPDNVMLVPGQPLALPKGAADRLEKARRNIEAKGYVEITDKAPEIDGVLGKIRAAIRDGKSSEHALQPISEIDFSALPFAIGRMPPDLIEPQSENFLYLIGSNTAVRVYTRTALGNIYLRELNRAKIGAGKPNHMIAGFPAHVTTLHYPRDRWVTAVVVGNGKRALYVQIGSRMETDADSALLDRMVVSLLTQYQS